MYSVIYQLIHLVIDLFIYVFGYLSIHLFTLLSICVCVFDYLCNYLILGVVLTQETFGS